MKCMYLYHSCIHFIASLLVCQELLLPPMIITVCELGRSPMCISGGRSGRSTEISSERRMREQSTLPAGLRAFRSHPTVNCVGGGRSLGKYNSSLHLGSELSVPPSIKLHLAGRRFWKLNNQLSWTWNSQSPQ
jgi:hypothetical protein